MTSFLPLLNSNDHVQGYPEASIELIEYGDFQEPRCMHAYPLIKMLQQNFGKALRFVYRHFPLADRHEYALPAAIAAEAAGRQGKFWEMHNLIFEKQPHLNEYSLLEFGMQLRLKLNAFKNDLLDDSISEKVKAHFESGLRYGVHDAPCFFINGEKYYGELDYVQIAEAMTEHNNII
jgi:protein-disulfide isomerase